MMTAVSMFCLLRARIIVNITEYDETVIKVRVASAIKPGLIHHFLHLKMPVPGQEYDSSCPFVFDAFCYLIMPCYYGFSELIFL